MTKFRSRTKIFKRTVLFDISNSDQNTIFHSQRARRAKIHNRDSRIIERPLFTALPNSIIFMQRAGSKDSGPREFRRRNFKHVHQELADFKFVWCVLDGARLVGMEVRCGEFISHQFGRFFSGFRVDD